MRTCIVHDHPRAPSSDNIRSMKSPGGLSPHCTVQRKYSTMVMKTPSDDKTMADFLGCKLAGDFTGKSIVFEICASSELRQQLNLVRLLPSSMPKSPYFCITLTGLKLIVLLGGYHKHLKYYNKLSSLAVFAIIKS